MKREDETSRTSTYEGHPPYCTCVECARKRQHRRVRKKKIRRELQKIANAFLIGLFVSALFALVYFLLVNR